MRTNRVARKKLNPKAIRSALNKIDDKPERKSESANNFVHMAKIILERELFRLAPDELTVAEVRKVAGRAHLLIGSLIMSAYAVGLVNGPTAKRKRRGRDDGREPLVATKSARGRYAKKRGPRGPYKKRAAPVAVAS